MRKFFCLLLPCLLLLTLAQAEPLPYMQLHQIDIGCADAYLLMAEDTVILVDCGTDTDVGASPEPLFDYLDQAGFSSIDAHFVTHYHNDHAINIDEISRRYGKDSTVLYGPSKELPERFLPLPHGTYCQLKDYDTLDIGPFHIQCVGPESDEMTGEDNYSSLNFIVTYGERTFFFTGDYVHYTVRERHLNEISNIDVLSFPHHGLTPICISNKTMKAVAPKIVLVPSNNRWDAKNFMQSLNLEPDVYASNGHIVILCDGIDLKLYTHVSPGQFAGKIG